MRRWLTYDAPVVIAVIGVLAAAIFCAWNAWQMGRSQVAGSATVAVAPRADWLAEAANIDQKLGELLKLIAERQREREAQLLAEIKRLKQNKIAATAGMTAWEQDGKILSSTAQTVSPVTALKPCKDVGLGAPCIRDTRNIASGGYDDDTDAIGPVKAQEVSPPVTEDHFPALATGTITSHIVTTAPDQPSPEEAPACKNGTVFKDKQDRFWICRSIWVLIPKNLEREELSHAKHPAKTSVSPPITAPEPSLVFGNQGTATNIITKTLSTDHVRKVKRADGAFEVHYEIDDNLFVSIPAVPGAQPHYKATITVYRVTGNKREMVGKPFPGEWTEKGCFEDDPDALVTQALKQAKEPQDGQITKVQGIGPLQWDSTMTAHDIIGAYWYNGRWNVEKHPHPELLCPHCSWESEDIGRVVTLEDSKWGTAEAAVINLDIQRRLMACPQGHLWWKKE